MSDLPPGFVLDQPAAKPMAALPEGFVLDKAPQTGSIMDVIKSAPRALLGGLSDTLAATGNTENIAMSQPQDAVLTKENTLGSLEKGVTGDLYKPQTAAGRISSAGIEQLANPLTYLGPGSAALKVGGGILSGAGGEAGQELTGSPYGRIAGALAGGIGAGKALGPSIEKAAVPTAEELTQAAKGGYDKAKNLGVEIKPSGVGTMALDAGQALEKDGINATLAPKTHSILSDLQNPPAGASVTIDNLETARRTLGNAAKDIQNPTERLAASKAIEHLDDYLANIPKGDVVAGDAKAASMALGDARGNYAAAKRSEDTGARITKAERAAARSGSGTNIDNTLRQKISAALDSKTGTRGWTQAEKDQAEKVVRGSIGANVARRIGKLGFGDGLSLLLHGDAAFRTGGLSVPVGIAGTISRKIAERMTEGQARKLDEMMRMRSPEYASRAAKIKPTDTSANKAAIVRALLQGVQ